MKHIRTSNFDNRQYARINQENVTESKKTLGKSATTYGGSHIPEGFKNNMQVLLQGNGSAPQIWSILSSVFFTPFSKKGFEIRFYNLFTGELTQLIVFRYVDNCNIILSGNNLDTNNQYIQYALSEWESLIEVTIISVAPNKSAWYLVYDVCHQGK